MLARWQGKKVTATLEGEAEEETTTGGLDNSFGFSKQFINRYEVGEEVGRGHFGYTCSTRFKKGEHKSQ